MSDRAESAGAVFRDAGDDPDRLQRFRTLVNAVDEGIFQLDADGRFVALNDAVVTATGYRREALLGEHVSSILEEPTPATERALTEPDGAGELLELDVRTADDERVRLDVQVNRLDTADASRGTVGTVRDVSRAGVDAERDDDGSPDDEGSGDSGGGVDGGDVDGGRTVADGDSDSGGGGGGRGSGDDGDDGARGDDGDDRRGDDGDDGERGDDRGDSERGEPRGDGAAIGERVGPGTVDPLPERERVLEALEAAREGISLLDEDGEFVYVNDAYADTFGYDSETMLGESWNDLGIEADPQYFTEEILPQIAEEGQWTGTTTCVRSDGSTFRSHHSLTDTEGDELVCLVRDVSDRERQKQELERYRTIVEAVNDGVYVVDGEGRFTMLNDAYAELLGYDREELLGEHVSLVVDDDVFEQAQELESAMRTDDAENRAIEAELETADGSRVVAEATFAMLPDDDGRGQRVGVVRDVTERKRTKQRLIEERDVFAQGPAVVFRWRNEPGWPVEYVSENVEDVLGYDPEDLVSGDVPYTDLLLEEEIDRIASEVEHNSDDTTDRFSHEPYRVRTSDGDVRWVRDTTKVVRDESGAVTHYLGYLVDITERKERERELQESKNQLRALVELLPVAVFVAEPDGQIVEWNEVAEEIWGGEIVESGSIAEYDAYDGWWADTREPVEPDEWALARALRGEEVTDPDVVEIEGFDGDRRTVLCHGMPVRDADGEVSRAVVTATDVTERREYRRRLEESNERLEQFAYAASHDLQEPLRMVSSYLQLIEGRYADELDEDGREFIEYAVDGAERMRNMIEGLLEYSRVETGGDSFEPVDLDDVLADVREDLQVCIQESGADVDVAPLPRVRGDEEQLRQVFQNLFDNAIEYSGDEPPKIEVTAERRREHWAIAVSDSGIGVDRDQTDRVFEIFHSLHGPDDHSGTGIGLALCQRIVERHGGDVAVESEPGEGSTFTVTLPAADEPET